MVLPKKPAAEPAVEDRVHHLADDERAMRVTTQHASDYADLWVQAYVGAAKRLRDRTMDLRSDHNTAGIDYRTAAAHIADATLDEYRRTQRSLIEQRSITAAMNRLRSE